MTKTRTVFLILSTLTIAACGGRSSLRTAFSDGGGSADGAAADGKRDGVADAAGFRDSPTSVGTPDAAVFEDAAPDTATSGSPDVRGADAPAIGDVRSADAGAADVLRRDGGGDVRFAAETRTFGDGPAPDVIRPDGNVRPDASVRPDGNVTIPDGRFRPDTGGGDVAPSLTAIEISPPNPTIVVGLAYTELVVTALFSDGTSSDVTASSSLASSDTSVVQVSGRTLTGQKEGAATVTASYLGRTAAVQVTVKASPLQSITIDGVVPVSVGQYILVAATGVFADGTKQDVTSQATWALSDSTLATLALDTATSKEKVTGVTAGAGSITATLQGITGKAPLTVVAAPMTRIDITPTQPILQRGVSQRFQATATFADGTTADVTSQATWSSSDTSVATVTSNATGAVVRAVGAGTATISATVGTVRGSTSVTVTTPPLLSIALTPSTWSPNVGGTQGFTATGSYGDGTTADLTISASWSSSNTNIVSVSNAAGQKGRATALAAGSAEIRATLGGVTGTAQVTVSASPLVSITVSPDPLNLILGLTGRMTAIGNYQNGTTADLTSQVAWTVSDASIAIISNAPGSAGQITGIAVGNTGAVATLAGIYGKALVQVVLAKLTSITVQPSAATVTAGGRQQFTAIGTYDNGTTTDLTTQVTWSSSDVRVAQVSNAAGSNGLATSLVEGRATITATLAGTAGSGTITVGAPLLSSIMISPTTASIQVGGTQTFSVTAVYQNGTTAAVAGTWSSSSESIATVASTAGGRRATATGVAAGNATITVTYQGLTDSASLAVTSVPTLVGLTISPESVPTLLVGATQQLQANAVYSNGSTTVVTATTTWTSSAATVASVSSGGGGPGGPGGGGRGLVTGIGIGTATITATYSGLTATITISVRDPAPTGLVVTPPTATIRIDGTQQFAAVVTLEDGTTQTVTNQATWTTSNGAVASITTAGGGRGGRGLATGISAGSVIVTATYGEFSATASLAVTAAIPTGLVVTPPAPSVQVGQTQAFVATVVFDDNTTANVTAQASWTSSNPAVASIQTAGGGGGGGGGGPGSGAGVALAIATGATTISASYDGFTGTATLTVVDPPLSYVQVTPTNSSIPVSATWQFTATAVFADNSTRDVTALATWSSSNASVAVVLGTGATAGRATALAEGSTTISATYQGVSGSSVLTVAGSVESITVTPSGVTTVLGLPVAFAATALLSTGSSLVVTGSAAWVTSDATIATVTAAGLATPVQNGTVTITASYLGKSGSTTLTISAAALSSIVVAPASVTVAIGGTQQLTATGNYSDGTTYDLTGVATWQSAASTIATVSNATGSRGFLTGVAAGSTSVTASFQSLTSSPPTPVTVN